MHLGLHNVSRRGLAVELAAAAVLLRYGAKLLGKWLSDRQYDGLEGSCRHETLRTSLRHGAALRHHHFAAANDQPDAHIPCIYRAGIVSFSSRIIAAWRALETEQQEALFRDPLAETLAGGRAMQRARKRIKVSIKLLCGKKLL